MLVFVLLFYEYMLIQVDCKPFRATFEGRWDAMVSKCAKCVLKLLEFARDRKRNYILDQVSFVHILLFQQNIIIHNVMVYTKHSYYHSFLIEILL